jgi:hypothetical protein
MVWQLWSRNRQDEPQGLWNRERLKEIDLRRHDLRHEGRLRAARGRRRRADDSANARSFNVARAEAASVTAIEERRTQVGTPENGPSQNRLSCWSKRTPLSRRSQCRECQLRAPRSIFQWEGLSLVSVDRDPLEPTPRDVPKLFDHSSRPRPPPTTECQPLSAERPISRSRGNHLDSRPWKTRSITRRLPS